jgi:hypothetical protein
LFNLDRKDQQLTATQLLGESRDRSLRQDPLYWPVRYRLEVIGFTVDGLVAAAGGWLFDRAMAGWDVNVRVDKNCDSRPLRILGASLVDVDSTGDSADGYPSVRELAIAVETIARDGKIRAFLSAALNRGYPTVTLWGNECPIALDRRFRRRRYRPSVAARMFKAQALGGTPAALGMAGGDEIFRSSTRIDGATLGAGPPRAPS